MAQEDFSQISLEVRWDKWKNFRIPPIIGDLLEAIL
jgi:hypothetical protein